MASNPKAQLVAKIKFFIDPLLQFNFNVFDKIYIVDKCVMKLFMCSGS